MLKNLWKIFFLFFSLYFLVLFQVSFLSHFAIRGVYPNLILIVILLFSIFKTFDRDFHKILGFVSGLFLDIFSPLPFGIFSLSLGLTGIFSKAISQNFKKINFFSVLSIFVAAIFIYELLIFFWSFIFNIPLRAFAHFEFSLGRILVSIIYNSFLALCGFGIVRFIKNNVFRKKV